MMRPFTMAGALGVPLTAFDWPQPLFVVVPAIYGIMGGMEKTTVYLTSDQKAALAQAAVEQGRSEARLIRAGIDAITAHHRVGEAPPVFADDVPGLPGRTPSPRRPRWIDRDAFIRFVLLHPADAALRAELRDLAPDNTDDEPLP